VYETYCGLQAVTGTERHDECVHYVSQKVSTLREINVCIRGLYRKQCVRVCVCVCRRDKVPGKVKLHLISQLRLLSTLA